MLVRTRFQAGVDEFLLPALQTQNALPVERYIETLHHPNYIEPKVFG